MKIFFIFSDSNHQRPTFLRIYEYIFDFRITITLKKSVLKFSTLVRVHVSFALMTITGFFTETPSFD